ncbi:MAG TPA: GNAT family N-acetyltransferase [Kofleriaceae bacterium]|nr:GNAT family N-acetyltransferase [Kofleriaceae bacterium]
MSNTPPRSTIPVLADLPLVIETARLRLRPYRDDDVEDLWPFVSDPALPKFMSWTAHKHRDETLGFLRGRAEALAKGDGIAWAIEHEGRACGSVSLEGVRWFLRALRVDCAELGYWLAPPLWGKGIMTEAANAAVKFGFDTIGLHKITVGCFEANAASRRVIEKVGFRFLCREEHEFWRDGRWHDHLRFELLASEWGDVARTQRWARI